jgi:uncharacterized protein (DUF1697 family)
MKSTAKRYIALLRGINVGGHHIVKMDELKKLLEKMGFTDVKTLLASGNVVFNSDESEIKALTSEIQFALKEKFGFEIPTLLRSVESIAKLAKSEPFKGVKVTETVGLYVTFLTAPHQPSFKIPFVSPNKDLKILEFTPGEVFFFFDKSKGGGTIQAMAIVEKEFGKGVTTRNWNTVLKLAAL